MSNYAQRGCRIHLNAHLLIQLKLILVVAL